LLDSSFNYLLEHLCDFLNHFDKIDFSLLDLILDLSFQFLLCAFRGHTEELHTIALKDVAIEFHLQI
jgi:hypothetical protein